mmetsp:Transcript_7938/g.16744  ORF Transcript_7938/g.16744 Transcript_7938/m.16744 type:complete len:207 (-) Transcript_7938:242-862(-)
MGNKPSMEDELINLKMTSRQMTSASKKSVKKEKEALSKVKKAIAQGNTEGARIYAQNAIREKNQQLNYLRLSSRIDAVAARLETAIQTQQISKSMKGVVQGMGQALQSMNVEKISATMTAFEQQFEDMEVITDTISDTMNTSTSSATPQEDVDSLIQKVADENQLELGSQLDDIGSVGTSTPAASEAKGEAKGEDDLAARLEALRH